MSKTGYGVIVLSVVLFCTSFVEGAATINFSPGVGGTWIYNGAGIFSFRQPVYIDHGLGSTSDTLVTQQARVVIPDLAISHVGSFWILTPIDKIKIVSASNTLLLSGNLGQGDLVPIGTGGLSYNEFQADITDVNVTSEGQVFGSFALNAIYSSGYPLDFSLTFQGATGGFENMLQDNLVGSDGFNGGMAIVIPVPNSLLLGLIGIGLVALMRAKFMHVAKNIIECSC
jgi:hypothetical protein